MEKRLEQDPEPSKVRIALGTGTVLEVFKMLNLSCVERAAVLAGLSYAERAHVEMRHVQADIDALDEFERSMRATVNEERVRVEAGDIHMQSGGEA